MARAALMLVFLFGVLAVVSGLLLATVSDIILGGGSFVVGGLVFGGLAAWLLVHFDNEKRERAELRGRIADARCRDELGEL